DVPFTLLVFLKGGELLAIPGGLTKVLRYYGHDDHFYTTGVEHPEDRGYSEEGSPGYLFDHQVAGTVPFYRYFNGKDHLYTRDQGEAVARPDYHDEGILGYVYAEDQPGAGTVPLYRYFNGQDHFYTTDHNELGDAR